MRGMGNKGSALLIVLGMMAFMIVSAVAFSAYMRYSRLPSSYLRRTVSSRMLVKAALAEAIDQVDAAIGNNPHPGVGTRPFRYPRKSGYSYNRNKWLGRVFIGGDNTDDNVYNSLTNYSDTVSTLCLEGLAYIPPPLVNEARYYSRRSNAAGWKNMDFDAGRYAFCAIDVSDYFDVNQLYADVPRSAHPLNRISLAYLFENSEHTSASGSMGTPAAWDSFMESYRTPWAQRVSTLQSQDKGQPNQQSGSTTSSSSTQIPLISMADWNLAVWDKKPAGWQSPFCNWVANNMPNFYGITDREGPDAEKIKRMCFVSDGLFPSNVDTTDPNSDYELNDPNYQPFKETFLESKNPNMASFVNMDFDSQGKERFRECLCSLGFAALYDYLDPNKVPVSLGIPTTERVPMICGVEPMINGLKVEIAPPEKNPNNGGNDLILVPGTGTRKMQREIIYRLNGTSFATGIMAARLKTLLAYPFRHKDGLSDTFEVDGRISFFFTSQDMGLRTGTAGGALSFTPNEGITQPELTDGVIAVPFANQAVSYTSTINSENDALKEVSLQPRSPNAVASILNSKVLLRVVYEWTQTDISATRGLPAGTVWDPQNPSANDLTQAASDLPPLLSTGSVDPQVANASSLQSLLQGGGNKKYMLNAAVWVRIKYNDAVMGNKTVDLAPACLLDDSINGINAQVPYMGLKQYLGVAYPLLRFDTGVNFDLSIEPATPTTSTATMVPQSAIVFDPRHNHAPESWFQQGESLSVASWLEKCHAHDADRDGDIFMMVSDQGYLQSIYELANLPRLTEFYKGTKYGFSGDYKCPSAVYGGLAIPSAETDIANLNVMWKTYDPFPDRYSVNGKQEGDDFVGAGFTSAGVGPKINPYSDNTNIIMAAFANTPHDWRCASVYNEDLNVANMKAQQFNKEYAWNEYSTGAKMRWEDLECFTKVFMGAMQHYGKQTQYQKSDSTDGSGSSGSYAFEEAWRNLASSNGDEFRFNDENGWYKRNTKSQELQNMLCGVDFTGDKLYNCDKKFLYGYWHDCFAAKQQLFLIFVRAEPSMMGSGAANQIPPQLGARAVALVWRDPRQTKQDNDPHKTRILFYRHFD